MTSPGEFHSFGAVLLGAGASTRMGRPKLLLPWGGTTVIGHLISQWRGLGVGQIAVVHRPDDKPLLAELDRLRVSHRIENPRPDRGMIGSVVCAAAWTGWAGDLSQWAIVLGDQPHLRMETLRTVLECAAQNPSKVCQPACSGRAGHPVILPADVFRALTGTDPGTLKDFLKPFSARTVHCSVTD
ncbi:MAG TPA: nucleotidyltransferase family protein, partial [Desulfuromonadaceae bacterium]|nr:nucleotidyltransferase family protein [Desulfuromonadaceae bacterium]